MKTPQVSWDEVAKDAAANLVKDTNDRGVRFLNAVREIGASWTVSP